MSNEQQVCQNFKFISINSNLSNKADIGYVNGTLTPKFREYAEGNVIEIGVTNNRLYIRSNNGLYWVGLNRDF